MLRLDSQEWSKLEDAYGSAAEVPKLLEELLENNNDKDNCWNYIWSRLCHQGTVYSATFAAFPYLVSLLKNQLDNGVADSNVFIFATCVEISRQCDKLEINKTVEKEYFLSLNKINEYIKKYEQHSDSYESLTAVLAFKAVRKNQPQLAELLLNLEEKKISELANFYYNL